jgi:hypothetical protein
MPDAPSSLRPWQCSEYSRSTYLEHDGVPVKNQLVKGRVRKGEDLLPAIAFDANHVPRIAQQSIWR